MVSICSTFFSVSYSYNMCTELYNALYSSIKPINLIGVAAQALSLQVAQERVIRRISWAGVCLLFASAGRDKL